MTTQTVDNKDRLAAIKNAQNALVYDLIMQALRFARTSKTSLSVWTVNDGSLMVSTGDKFKRGFAQFGDNIKNEEIDVLVDIVEWLLDGAPEEEAEPEEDD